MPGPAGRRLDQPVFIGPGYHLDHRRRSTSGLAMTSKFATFLPPGHRRHRGSAAPDAEPLGAGEQGGRERLAFFLGAGPELGRLLRPMPYFGSVVAVLL